MNWWTRSQSSSEARHNIQQEESISRWYARHPPITVQCARLPLSKVNGPQCLVRSYNYHPLSLLAWSAYSVRVHCTGLWVTRDQSAEIKLQRDRNQSKTHLAISPPLLVCCSIFSTWRYVTIMRAYQHLFADTQNSHFMGIWRKSRRWILTGSRLGRPGGGIWIDGMVVLIE